MTSFPLVTDRRTADVIPIRNGVSVPGRTASGVVSVIPGGPAGFIGDDTVGVVEGLDADDLGGRGSGEEQEG